MALVNKNHMFNNISCPGVIVVCLSLKKEGSEILESQNLSSLL